MKLLLLLLIAKEVWCSNILMVGLTISHSHHFWMESLGLGLVDKGHNVTFLSLDPTKVKRDNYTVITLEGVHEAFEYGYTSESLVQIVFTPLTIPPFVNSMFDYMLEICKMELHHSGTKKLLSYPKNFKFDVVIWDHTFGECMYPIIEHFGNPPTIGVSPYGLSDTVESIYGAHVYPYVGSIVMPFVEASTLWQRFLNVFYINYNLHIRDTTFKKKSVDISRTVFPDWDESKYDRTEAEFNLVLLNWNVAINQGQPLSPNMIPVGGIQIKENAVLAKDVKEIFARPSSGVIFFSLGSNSKSESLSAGILQSFTDCFAAIPDYQIIWKIKPPSSLKLSANVNALSWVQQTAVLAQPKTKLFITHGGGLSTQETTYFGVPILGIPLFIDQTNNANKLKTRGAGEVVELVDIQKSKGLFCEKVKQVIFNDSYARNMKKLSKKYKDKETTPLETGVYWVEYVLRHGHAKELSPVSRHMSVFYTQNLDIYLICIVIFVLPLCIMWALLSYCWKSCCRNASKEKTA